MGNDVEDETRESKRDARAMLDAGEFSEPDSSLPSDAEDEEIDSDDAFDSEDERAYPQLAKRRRVAGAAGNGDGVAEPSDPGVSSDEYDEDNDEDENDEDNMSDDDERNEAMLQSLKSGR